jgi:hypothetical protein
VTAAGVCEERPELRGERIVVAAGREWRRPVAGGRGPLGFGGKLDRTVPGAGVLASSRDHVYGGHRNGFARDLTWSGSGAARLGGAWSLERG